MRWQIYEFPKRIVRNSLSIVEEKVKTKYLSTFFDITDTYLKINITCTIEKVFENSV